MKHDRSDDCCQSAGAYVIGALGGADRHDFEAHLATCAECRAAVAELAGLPGLLARTSVADLADPLPLPDTLLPRVLARLRRRSRRRRLLAVGAAAVVVLVAGGGGYAALHGRATDTSAVSPAGTVMTALVSAPIRATADLRPEGTGTRIDLHCTWAGASPEDLPPYVLVVTGRDGTDRRLATWRVGPGGETRVVGSVALPPTSIAAVEVRTDTGTPVLRLRR